MTATPPTHDWATERARKVIRRVGDFPSADPELVAEIAAALREVSDQRLEQAASLAKGLRLAEAIRALAQEPPR